MALRVVRAAVVVGAYAPGRTGIARAVEGRGPRAVAVAVDVGEALAAHPIEGPAVVAVSVGGGRGRFAGVEARAAQEGRLGPVRVGALVGGGRAEEGHAVVVPVEEAAHRLAFVDQAVAVVVDVVAGLGDRLHCAHAPPPAAAGLGGSFTASGQATVLGGALVAIATTLDVVDRTGAVLVGRAITDLDGARVDGRDPVVAVGGRGGEPGPPATVEERLAGHRSESVAVAVGEELDQHSLVHRAVAVVVEAVADLRCARVHRSVAVVAVLPAAPLVAAGGVAEAVAVHVTEAVGRGVAVLVHVVDVAELDRARVPVGVRIVAVVAAAFDGPSPIAVRVFGGVAAGEAAVGGLVALLRALEAGGGLDAPRPHAALEPVAEDSVVAIVVGGAARSRVLRGRRRVPTARQHDARHRDARQHQDERNPSRPTHRCGEYNALWFRGLETCARWRRWGFGHRLRP